MNTQHTPCIIQETNFLVRRAIAYFRVCPGPDTKSSIYDALNRRRNARLYVMPKWEEDEWHQMSRWEMTFAEKQSRIHAMRLHRSGGST